MSAHASTIDASILGTAAANVTYSQPSVPFYAKEESQSAKVRHATLPHWHEGVEFIHVLGGGMRCTINEEVLDLKSGDFCFINRRQMHVADSGDHGDYRANVIVVDPAMMTRNDEVFNHYISPILEEESFTHFHLSNENGTAADLGQYVDEIAELQTNQPPAFELTVIGLLHLVFQRIYMVFSSGEVDFHFLDADAAAQRKMSSYIYEHFNEKVTLDDIAAAGNVSRSKCSKVFKRYLQKSPIDFLNMYRLEVASRLLVNTDESISRIALSCGFSQQSYFTRLFARTYECTPREYRDRYATQPA